jgi:hypothetical protein
MFTGLPNGPVALSVSARAARYQGSHRTGQHRKAQNKHEPGELPRSTWGGAKLALRPVWQETD